MYNKKISSALISVFNKKGLEPLIQVLVDNGVSLYSTGGTERFIQDMGHEVNPIENLTGYPSILGGRVKTLHPKVFGGILSRSENPSDQKDLESFEIPTFELVIVDLYPFENTITDNATESEIIEKIDIGGIALIRAAAKNFKDVLCISNKEDYTKFINIYNNSSGAPSLEDRKTFAVKAFHNSSHYDSAIFNHFNETQNYLNLSSSQSQLLRYGENPHQKGYFYGPLSDLIEHVHGKEISYNNLLDIDAAVTLMSEFYDGKPAFGILKHNNACGFAIRETLAEAYSNALASDPISAFGGVLISNKTIDVSTSKLISELFCEVIIAPAFQTEALEILKRKKNRIILIQKENKLQRESIRSCLNGVLLQDRDLKTEQESDLIIATQIAPSIEEVRDLLFASKICKHTKSNTIVIAKNHQLIASGTGQTSRVDALNQAIQKAKKFNFNLKNAVMASDAFFPFPDCVEIANKSGINSVIQPGGSINDNLSISYCDNNGMRMVLTGTRHFKH